MTLPQQSAHDLLESQPCIVEEDDLQLPPQPESAIDFNMLGSGDLNVLNNGDTLPEFISVTKLLMTEGSDNSGDNEALTIGVVVLIRRTDIDQCTVSVANNTDNEQENYSGQVTVVEMSEYQTVLSEMASIAVKQYVARQNRRPDRIILYRSADQLNFPRYTEETRRIKDAVPDIPLVYIVSKEGSGMKAEEKILFLYSFKLPNVKANYGVLWRAAS